MKRSRHGLALLQLLATLIFPVSVLSAQQPPALALRTAIEPVHINASGGKSRARPSRPSRPLGKQYGHRADVLRFARQTAATTGLDLREIAKTLAQARYQASVVKAVMPGPTGARKNWSAYRDRFIDADRIAAGNAFWSANEVWLSQAEQRYGVPAAIVSGIVGVETYFGRITGGYRVVDALATLSFDFPKGRSDRSAFFREQLARLLVLSQRNGVDPSTIMGSFAGAIGLPQFMPGSVLDFAVDFDGDGRVDLTGSAADAIGSVASFLAAHGWVRGLVTHVEATAPSDPGDRALLLAPDIEPRFSLGELLDHGAQVGAGIADSAGLLALVELDNGDEAPSHVVTTRNFYVLTRYNRSAYYARAVAELGAAIAAARAPGQAARDGDPPAAH
jgi:membrane-bound lytic murein transglycosylase B